MEARKVLKSGEFLVSETDSKDVFIPEEFNEEQLMIAQTCKDFLEMEVYPNVDNVDKQDRDLMKSMLKKSGELGLMGISIPEEYNGFGQSFVKGRSRLPTPPAIRTTILSAFGSKINSLSTSSPKTCRSSSTTGI